MRIVHVSESDTLGGAAKGAYNLHHGLLNIGAASTMIVGRQQRREPQISSTLGKQSSYLSTARHALDQLPFLLNNPSRLRRKLNPNFSSGILPKQVLKKISDAKPDVVVLHWINRGFFPFWLLPKMPWPTIIFARDSWWSTGGCHVPGACTKFITACGACPLLDSSFRYDATYWLHKWKKSIAAQKSPAPRHVFVLSNWMGGLAKKSMWGKAGMPVHVFGNAIDTTIFKPLDQGVMRALWNLPLDKKIIAFSALEFEQDANKGADLLKAALAALPSHDNIALLLLGGAPSPAWREQFSFPIYGLGKLQEETTLAAAYNAADVVVVPSRYEAYCKSAAEALACGVPVVSFDASGTTDLVRHMDNGYLAKAFDSADFSAGIQTMINLTAEQRKAVALSSRKGAVQQADAKIQAQAFLDYCAAQGWGS